MGDVSPLCMFRSSSLSLKGLWRFLLINEKEPNILRFVFKLKKHACSCALHSNLTSITQETNLEMLLAILPHSISYHWDLGYIGLNNSKTAVHVYTLEKA